jgi:hypothetical protein
MPPETLQFVKGQFSVDKIAVNFLRANRFLCLAVIPSLVQMDRHHRRDGRNRLY